MSKFHLCLSSLILLTSLTVSAESKDRPDTPKPPFVALMPDNSTWTVELTRKGLTAAPPPGARLAEKIINTKFGSTRNLTTLWSDGSRSDLWFFQGYRIEQAPGSIEIQVTDLEHGIDPENRDYTDFDWLDLSHYIGVETMDNQSCYYFKARVKPAYVRTTYDYSAYINVKTKRPVAWDIGSTHYEIASVEERKSTEPLALPEAFSKQLAAYRLASRPGNFYKNQ